jgi:tripartite-type tricarboxylate transporter receptor subunit TctC
MSRTVAGFIRTLVGAMLALALVVPAQAQKYPERSIRLVVPYAPGGSVDILGRILAEGLGQTLGQQVIVDNRGGGGATIGTNIVAKAPPDGYTLLLADIAFGANPALHSKLPYDTPGDFQPVALVALLPSILVVNPQLGVHTVGELVKMAKDSPGKLNYSSAGVGSMNYLADELFKKQNDIDVVHIPYQSGGQAMTAILGGQAQMCITTIPPVLQHIRSGKIVALAVSGAKRQSSLPDVPTFAEAGFPAFDVSLWQGVLVPAGTPPDVVEKLNGAINRALELPNVRKRIADLGAEPAGGSAQQFATYINGEIARWKGLIKPEMRVN